MIVISIYATNNTNELNGVITLTH